MVSKIIFFCDLTLTFFPVSFIAETEAEGASPGKKRRTESDAKDSSVELGEEDSFSVCEEEDDNEGLESSFLEEEGSVLE